MKRNLTQKILGSHLYGGELVPGSEISLRIDQTLLQDATGTMALLEFEALGIDSIGIGLAVQYVDHNILQTDNKNADDHRYLQTASARYGIIYSGAGNGVSHQVHMERFGVPGKILLGADSHTPGAAGVSMLGIGAGGLDVALAMAGYPYHLPCPKVLGVRLTGELPPWVSAKDIILEMLRRYDVRGCVGKIVEYYGPGVKSLSATDRETIGNMGTELGATSTVFPSDENTKSYLQAQGRGESWVGLEADDGAAYDEHDEIDLSKVEPVIAKPSSPGNVVTVREVSGIRVDQVIVGSSVNSSFRDLMVVAKILDGRHCHDDVSLHINPGSRQVMINVAAQGGLVALLTAGARIHEPGCLGCIGMGQAPGTGQVSLRTFPRNFPGRSGTKDDRVYLCSPETAAAAALTGVITDPRELGKEMAYPRISDPRPYIVDESSIIFPSENLRHTEIVRGPNIKPIPELDALPETLEAEVVLKVGDNISTDTILPAGNKILPLRSNIDAISVYTFSPVDPDFHRKCREKKNVVVIGGENYGQGSSREHAALAPRYLGVRVKIARSFARIHRSNLCNFGILPLVFRDREDYDRIPEGSIITFPEVRRRIERGDREIPAVVKGITFFTLLDVSVLERRHLLAGGTLNFVREELRRSSKSTGAS
ncbi:MAG TPA: aconitate hydratase [Dissulfurispiraceae bacterium]|nr:aconitate hydratase [Dissulfurispiraceae bacterium]